MFPRIVYESDLTEAKTRQAVAHMFSKQEINNIFITPEDLEDQKGANSLVNSNTLLIIGDVSRPSLTLYPRLLELVDKVLIIDHPPPDGRIY